MKNRATVFSVDLAVMTTRRLAIVPPTENSAAKLMPTDSNNPLQDYLLRVMDSDCLSFQKIEDNARAEGGTLGRATIQQIAKGSTTNPGIYTLVELSWGIKRPLEEVMKVALGRHLVDASVFDKSHAGRVWKAADELPSAEHRRMIRRYLQMIEREIQRLLRGE